MFSSDIEYSEYSSNANGFVVEIEDQSGSSEFNYEFSPAEGVTRGMMLVETSIFGLECHQEEKIEIERPKQSKQAFNFNFSQQQVEQLTFPCLHRAQCLPRIVPAIPMNQSFDTTHNVETCIRFISGFLQQQQGLVVSFLECEHTWCCSLTQGALNTSFEIRIFRYSRSHANAGSLVIEMQRSNGDRMLYFNIFEGVKGLFLPVCEPPNPIASIDFDVLPTASAVDCSGNDADVVKMDDDVVSEEDIKLTLLAMISSSNGTDYKTTLEAVQIAATIFAGGRLLSNVDLQILFALEHLSVSNAQFYWIQPFVIEKRQSLTSFINSSGNKNETSAAAANASGAFVAVR